MVGIGYTTADLKAIPAASKVSGYSKLAKRQDGAFSTPGNPALYTWFDDENASADLGDLILRPDDGIGFYVISGDRTYYAASDPPSLPLTTGTMAALGYFEWINTATSTTYRYLGGSGFVAVPSGGGDSLISSGANAISSAYTPSSLNSLSAAFSAETNRQLWFSDAQGGSVPGNAWIGQNFGTSRTVSRIEVEQLGIAYNDTDRQIETADVQTSSDGSSWTTLETVTLSWQPFYTSSFLVSATTQYIRLLAATGAPSFGWNVYRVRIYGS